MRCFDQPTIRKRASSALTRVTQVGVASLRIDRASLGSASLGGLGRVSIWRSHFALARFREQPAILMLLVNDFSQQLRVPEEFFELLLVGIARSDSKSNRYGLSTVTTPLTIHRPPLPY
jgi:hypothetical protein